MFNGKNKAITFSYDDGVTQDVRLIEIFDRYGLKATFNINSELLGLNGELVRDGVRINHTKNSPEKVKEIYKNHEVAAHTLTHPLLTELSDEEIIYQVETDRKNLERLVDKPVIGMAYPGGGINYDKRVARVIKESTEIKYARTTVSSYNFDLQTDLYTFRPTVYHHQDWKKMIELSREFLELKTYTPKILYIWGHSYEFDINNSWEDFESFCETISGKNDIFYGTNSEVLL
jgi:peptidoglycan/xylan/chitin deacetylase (PgdA/CDA1 family)